MKKIYLYFIIIIILILISLGVYLIINNKQESDSTDKTYLVVYYSATGNTEKVAQKIAEKLNADIFEIVPSDDYTSDDLDWNNSDSRVSKEHADQSLRDVSLETTKVNDWKKYDTVLIGYPIWWGEAAWPVNTFIKNNDFTNKDIYTFCTSESSRIDDSTDLLKAMNDTGNWVSGIRFSEDPSDDDIQEFINPILNKVM